jgi:ABC-2 type transport system ATP-binding protein
VLLREAFTELRDRGRTLIFSTHQMEAAEALCESVAIVDHGRLVAGGRVRDLKRASGRRTLRLAVDGDLGAAWLAELPGIVGLRPDHGGFALELLAGADSAVILAAVLERGAAVTRFEVVEPTLEALFIEHVGHPSEEVSTLVPEGAAPSLSAGGMA